MVGAGDTISLAQRSYNTALNATNSFAIEEGDQVEISGTVARIASESDTEGLLYKIILQEQEDKIFILSPALSQELALTLPGDQVAIAYYETEDGVIQATGFDNKEYKQNKS